jgi:GT2 family glycosyltransferase
MYKKIIWSTVSGYDESMIFGWEDYDFWLRAAKEGFNFKKCNSTFLYYRQGFSQFSQVHSNDNNIKMQNIKNYLRQKHKGFYLG